MDAANATQKVRRGRQVRDHHAERAAHGGVSAADARCGRARTARSAAILDGTVFRAPILIDSIQPVCEELEKAHHHRPSRLRRRVQAASSSTQPSPATRRWRSRARAATEQSVVVQKFDGPGVWQGQHNKDGAIQLLRPRVLPVRHRHEAGSVVLHEGHDRQGL